MRRKICVVTGTRAEFGLLRWLMEDIRQQATLELQVIATGMHLSPEFGLTYNEIEDAGFQIDAKIEMLLAADTPSAITKSMGLGLIGFADAYTRLAPDIVVVLGDRFEILAAATAALFARIPIAHLHGGETTEGAFDEAIRHSITKMSQLHFVAAEEYRKRVIQLGENPDRVFQVGGLGVDAIQRIKLLDRDALEKSLDFKFQQRNLLITFHPVTLEGRSSAEQMTELLHALGELNNTGLIFTMPNADTGNHEISQLIREFVAKHPNSRAFDSLGQLKYFSCMQYVDAVVGNSSSGIAEAPSMGIGTIDIGDRQKGRLRATSVIHCEPNRQHISQALIHLFSTEFKANLVKSVNPYGTGGASKAIATTLASQPITSIVKKQFYDLASF